MLIFDLKIGVLFIGLIVIFLNFVFVNKEG